QRRWPLRAGDRFLHKASLSFDISVWEMLAPLASGATVVVVAGGGERDAAGLGEEIRRKEVTVAHFSPGALQAFVEVGGESASLAHIFCGGEKLSAELRERVLARYGAGLYHQYGPTETTIDVLARECVRGGGGGEVTPLGRPMDNTA